MIRFPLLLLLLLLGLSLYAQNHTESINLSWQTRFFLDRGQEREVLTFKNAFHDQAQPKAPWFQLRQSTGSMGSVEVALRNARYEEVTENQLLVLPELQNEVQIIAHTRRDRGQAYACISIMPLRRNPQTGKAERLLAADLVWSVQAESNRRATRNFASNSMLSTGQWFKLGVQNTGIHRLDASFFQNLGLDLNQINPQQIQIFSREPGPLSETNNASLFDDLVEIAIEVNGEADARFDANDEVLFYAYGPKRWMWNAATTTFQQKTHTYSNETYYYLRINQAQGQRIANQAAASSTDYNSDAYDWLGQHEVDALNLMEEAFALPPSGRMWFGEIFQFTRTRSFSFSIPNRISTEPVQLQLATASRHLSGSGSFSLSSNGQIVHTNNHSTVSSYIYDLYADYKSLTGSFTQAGNDLNFDLTYNQNYTSSIGWLDFLKVQARASLQFTGGQMPWRDSRSLGHNGARYRMAAAPNNLVVWEVSNWQSPRRVQGSVQSSIWQADVPCDQMYEFVAFDGSSYFQPSSSASLANQNVHALNPVDLVIVYPREFAAQAQRLAQHRAQVTGMSVSIVDIDAIYNEFSAGSQDPTAIRDFAKMLYDRSNQGNGNFQYLLLFGNGSFDYRNLKNRSNPANFIPVYETENSLHPTLTYTTEDYFALLDDGEGSLGTPGGLDIGVGRLPVASASEAEVLVSKIIDYETSEEALGDWRTRLTFVADDEDAGTHLYQADSIARHIERSYPEFAVNKIYLDAYRQQSTAGGNRYPDVNQAILSDIFRGTLIWDYAGHGGEDGLAQERIFTNIEINSLNNGNKLPLFVTATCSFSPHDDPNIVSAGELLLLNPQGGGIAGLTTVRVVYAQDNFILTDNTFRQLFSMYQGRRPTLGEVLTESKNISTRADAANSRKFVLLGDPSLTLAYPQERVVLTQINGQNPSGNDTLRALEQVQLQGEIRNAQNQLLADFNGEVQVTVYDKTDTLTTRRNDNSSPASVYTLQNKIIFKGRASVQAGRFSLSFVVPRDINYSMGKGKILSYAFEPSTGRDAQGVDLGFWIGGTADTFPEDNKPPVVRVYMNDENFASGGITDENPVLLVKLEDEHGINITGNSVGHDLSASLEASEAMSQSYVLNDFYETDLNDFRKGTVRYPLKDLPEGLHKVTVQAWDVYNNVGEGSTEFIVSTSAELALKRVLNYPNPFTTSTRFQFEHNFPNRQLEVLVRIYTVSGKLVKNIQHRTFAEGYRIDDIAWDGLDDYGQTLGKGVYIYQVTVRVENSDKEEEWSSAYQKLVLLR